MPDIAGESLGDAADAGGADGGGSLPPGAEPCGG